MKACRVFLILLGVVLVQGPALAQIQTLELQEQWRQGGEDSDLFFGNVLQVLPAPAEGLFVLDTQLMQVFHLDSSGELVRTLGGRGEGPGQVNNINSMVHLADGRLGLGQVLPGAMVCVDGNGDPAGKFRIRDREDSGSAYVLLMNGWTLGDDLLTISMQWHIEETGAMTQDMFLRSYDLQGAPLVDFVSKSIEYDLGHFVFTEAGFDFVWNRCAVTPEGNVVFAPERDRYLIKTCTAGGQQVRTTTRQAEQYRRDGPQREEARRSQAAIAAQYGRPVAGVETENTDPVVTGAVQAYRRETNSETDGGLDDDTMLEVVCFAPGR